MQVQSQEKCSIDLSPGNYDNRVFVGGNYQFGTVIQQIADAVSGYSFTPIVAACFAIKPGTERESSLKLLRQCKFAIFEVTLDGGYIAELERALDYNTRTLCLWDAWQSDNPRISAMVTSNPVFISNNKGYKTTREKEEAICKFLKEDKIET